MRLLLPVVALLPVALLAGTHSAAAQAGVPRSMLVVRVVDEQGHALTGARVTVGGVAKGASTGSGGDATVEQIPEGLRLVEVRRQGYAPHRVAADFIRGSTVRREVVMTPDPVELEGLTVTSWGRSVRLRNNGFYERQRRGFGAYMTRDQIERLHPYHATDAFRYMRGFMVATRKSREYVVATRGSGGAGGCVPPVYLDGNRMFTRSAEDQADALESVPPENIEAIEAYQGAASTPPEYSLSGSTCGVILIWTRG